MARRSVMKYLHQRNVVSKTPLPEVYWEHPDRQAAQIGSVPQKIFFGPAKNIEIQENNDSLTFQSVQYELDETIQNINTTFGKDPIFQTLQPKNQEFQLKPNPPVIPSRNYKPPTTRTLKEHVVKIDVIFLHEIISRKQIDDQVTIPKNTKPLLKI